jgi:hypothetical protein
MAATTVSQCDGLWRMPVVPSPTRKQKILFFFSSQNEPSNCKRLEAYRYRSLGILSNDTLVKTGMINPFHHHR